MSGRRGSARPAAPWLVPLGLAITGGLALVIALVSGPDIESTLAGDARAALTAAGITGGEVSFDGRDATLRGFPAEQAQRAADRVRQVPGVRVVEVPSGSTRQSPAPSPGPAPADGKRALQERIDTALAAAPITFRPDTAELTGPGRRTAETVAGLLRTAAPGTGVDIAGHVARAPGDPAAAMRLSQDRAETVRSLLTAAGVAGEGLTATGYGDTRPAASGDSRRVEITVR